jgi:hypothetical protein
MFRFCCCEFFQGENLRFDFSRFKGFDNAKIEGSLQFFFDLFGNFELFVIIAEDRTRILKASIMPLSIYQCWIMKGEEKSTQFFKMLFRVIQLHVKNFDMSRLACTYLFIIGAFDAWFVFWAHKAYGCLLDRTWEFLLEVCSQAQKGENREALMKHAKCLRHFKKRTYSNILLGSPITTSAESHFIGNVVRSLWGWASRNCLALGVLFGGGGGRSRVAASHFVDIFLFRVCWCFAIDCRSDLIYTGISMSRETIERMPMCLEIGNENPARTVC